MRRACELAISVVVPVLDDEVELGETLARLPGRDGVEVVVVDGGSRDGSVAVAEALADRVVRSEPGRARQLNRGAELASGEVLMFLHADTHLPACAWASVESALADPAVVAGAFDVALRARGRVWNLLARAASWRARRTGIPYGDQALFVRREAFEAVGRFPDQPVLEDVALSQRLKRLGRIVFVDEPVRNSVRRWRSEGVVYTVVRNWAITLLFVAGMPAERLARFYPTVR